jgi:tetratricopeptide (TPR) repeat protein
MRGVTAADLAAVYELLGDVRYLLGEHQRADDSFKAARRLLGTGSADSGRLALKQAKLSTRQGNYQTALRRVSRALKGLERIPGPEAAGHRARLYVWYGWIRFNQDRPLETIVWCRRGEQVALEAGARDALAQAYQFLDPAYDESGQIEQAVYSARALEIYEELDDLWQQGITLNNMGVTAKALSKWNDSRLFYDRALRLFETTGDRTMGCLAKYNMAELLLDQGLYDEAEPLLRQVIRVWRASGGDPDHAAAAKRELGRLLARRGDVSAALELLQSARADQVQAGQPLEVLTTDFRLAEMIVLSGDGAGALELVEELLPRCAGLDAAMLMPGLLRVDGWALIQSGRWGEAREQLDQARTLAGRRGDLYEECLALDALVALGSLTGEDVGELEDARGSLVDELGIVQLPLVPGSERQDAVHG